MLRRFDFALRHHASLFAFGRRARQRSSDSTSGRNATGCFRTTGLALAATLIAQPAASCFICDDIVEFDPATAQCFLANVQDYLAQAEADTAARVEVNLTGCSPERSIDSFPTFKRSLEDGESSVGLIYTLEAPSVLCLEEKLSDKEITTIVSFVLEEDCPID